MAVLVRDTELSPFSELEAYQQRVSGEADGKFGAMAAFVGFMRDFNLGDAVIQMTLEHYPGMTESRLEQIVDEAKARWDLIDVLLIHRVGKVLPNAPIVIVAVWTSHRAAAFDACRHIMEALKNTAPFWKKETLEKGERWVESNTEG